MSLICVYLTLGMLLSQLVQDVGRIEAGIVAQLTRDDLEGLGDRSNQQLFLASNGPGVVAQHLGQFHLNGTTT